MSPYQRSVVINLPYYSTSCQIRIIRLLFDGMTNVNNELYFSSYTEIVDGQLAYDDTSVMSMTIDAEAVPQRAAARLLARRDHDANPDEL